MHGIFAHRSFGKVRGLLSDEQRTGEVQFPATRRSAARIAFDQRKQQVSDLPGHLTSAEIGASCGVPFLHPGNGYLYKLRLAVGAINDLDVLLAQQRHLDRVRPESDTKPDRRLLFERKPPVLRRRAESVQQSGDLLIVERASFRIQRKDGVPFRVASDTKTLDLEGYVWS